MQSRQKCLLFAALLGCLFAALGSLGGRRLGCSRLCFSRCCRGCGFRCRGFGSSCLSPDFRCWCFFHRRSSLGFGRGFRRRFSLGLNGGFHRSFWLGLLGLGRCWSLNHGGRSRRFRHRCGRGFGLGFFRGRVPPRWRRVFPARFQWRASFPVPGLPPQNRLPAPAKGRVPGMLPCRR